MTDQPFWIIVHDADGNLYHYEHLQGEVFVGDAQDVQIPVPMSNHGQAFRIISGKDGPEIYDLTADDGVSINGQLIPGPIHVRDNTKLILPGFTALYVFTNVQSFEEHLRTWEPVEPGQPRQETGKITLPPPGIDATERIYRSNVAADDEDSHTT